jgi:hypothetical protein
VVKEKGVRFADEDAAAPAAAAPVAGGEEAPAPVPASGGEEAPAAPAPAEPKPKAATITDEFTARIKRFEQKYNSAGRDVVPYTGEPKITTAYLATATDLRKQLDQKPDVEVNPKIYRPISSPAFPQFIVSTYHQYSKFLKATIDLGSKEAAREALLAKEPNPDACKLRDPNKVETFYYQKFVRDYLSYGSPYRGLLVYHGLGSGKTCTSIAAAEALYWGGKKRIYVLTPATLSNNYRRELGKCGYFPLRQENHWSFLSTEGKTALSKFWLINTLGLPEALVLQQKGGWVADPTKPSNWDSLTADAKASIRKQQASHMNHRFRIIHYNGVPPQTLAALAARGVTAGTSEFDDAVIIVDEIHNLVRTINGTQIGSTPIFDVMKDMGAAKKKDSNIGAEPREFTWSTPLGRERPGFLYPRGYTLYRLLQNAVGSKVIALSATPMINYAQEFAILMNMIAGEQRLVEISLAKMDRSPATARRLEDWLKARPDVDFYAIEESMQDRKPSLSISPVPHGFEKVQDAAGMVGFQRVSAAKPAKESRERNLDQWAVEIVKGLRDAGILTPEVAVEAETAVAAARATMTPVESTSIRLRTLPLLPDDPKTFVESFIDKATLNILNAEVLKARSMGLISYYRGGSEELMPRARSTLVRVDMSEYMFQEYTKARMEELDAEMKTKKPTEGAAVAEVRGRTAFEKDLYAQATKTIQTGFLYQSRAACNWVFPADIPRPKISAKDLGLEEKEGEILVTDADIAVGPPPPADGDAEPTEADLGDAEAAATSAAISSIVGPLMAALEAKAAAHLKDSLREHSPKYAMILDKIRESPGPVLVYSQFKTLEGLGIFAAALRAAEERFIPLDIIKDADGDWVIPDELMEPGRPRYVMYTGDQDLDKRRLLLQLYNADVGGLPPILAEQCKALLAGAPDNRDGRVCKVFMITQSGAEGISLFNTRQVHVMEPYWNNVRLQQVIGRAIRLCSHMNLPWEDRTVDVFTYLSVFTAVQKSSGSASLIMRTDAAKTTDEQIFEIATTKQKLADGLFDIAQIAAADCNLHYFEHGENAATACYVFPPGKRTNFMFHPDIAREIAPVKK